MFGNERRVLVLGLGVMSLSLLGSAALGAESNGDTGGSVELSPLPLYVEAIPGLTTVAHRAPAQTGIPIGTVLRFSQELVDSEAKDASASRDILWTNAVETYNDGLVSIAECPLTQLGLQTVTALVRNANGDALWENTITLDVMPIRISDIRVDGVTASVSEFYLDETATNDMTMNLYFGASIAMLRAHAVLVRSRSGLRGSFDENPRYSTSIDRTVYVNASVQPPELAPLIELRVDGAAVTMGTLRHSFAHVGTHVLSVGPPRNATLLEMETYKTIITSHVSTVDLVAEGEPITFEAATDPPGFEDDITWLSSTKWGTASPVVGHGPTFTMQFDDTWTEEGQWLGVRADNALFGQDQKVVDMITDFQGSDPVAADIAYLALYDLGVDAIGPLLGITDNAGPYAGSAYQNSTSSVLIIFPEIRVVAIHLIDGMLWGTPTPHYAPVIKSLVPQDPSISIDQAIALYTLWWDVNAGLTLPELQALPFPLAGSGVRWHGPLVFVPTAPGSGTEVPGSSTPADLSAMPPNVGGEAYSWCWAPDTAGGPKPYNCLAWALGCQTDRWTQPNSVVAGGAVVTPWQTILSDHGYDTANSVACAGTCPAGTGPKIKMIFQGTDGCSDGDWTHAMKQEADGDWTSKNGDGPLWNDINNCEAFLQKHYKPDAGNFQTVKCFCK